MLLPRDEEKTQSHTRRERERERERDQFFFSLLPLLAVEQRNGGRRLLMRKEVAFFKKGRRN